MQYFISLATRNSVDRLQRSLLCRRAAAGFVCLDYEFQSSVLLTLNSCLSFQCSMTMNTWFFRWIFEVRKMKCDRHFHRLPATDLGPRVRGFAPPSSANIIMLDGQVHSLKRKAIAPENRPECLNAPKGNNRIHPFLGASCQFQEELAPLNVQEFWKLWNHMPQPSELFEQVM